LPLLLLGNRRHLYCVASSPTFASAFLLALLQTALTTQLLHGIIGNSMDSTWSTQESESQPLDTGSNLYLHEESWPPPSTLSLIGNFTGLPQGLATTLPPLSLSLGGQYRNSINLQERAVPGSSALSEEQSNSRAGKATTQSSQQPPRLAQANSQDAISKLPIELSNETSSRKQKREIPASSDPDWGKHRADILRMYISENKPLKDIIDLMRREHGFDKE
jgi:hypothetical protein